MLCAIKWRHLAVAGLWRDDVLSTHNGPNIAHWNIQKFVIIL